MAAAMDDALVQAYARLTVHEFALEVMMANWVASMPASKAETFLEGFAARAESSWAAGEPAVDEDQAHQITRDAIELQRHFMEKVRRRTDQIRTAQAH